MIVTLQNWIQPDIVGIMGVRSQNITAVDHIQKSRMDISMEPQDQTLLYYWRKIRIGGQSDS